MLQKFVRFDALFAMPLFMRRRGGFQQTRGD